MGPFDSFHSSCVCIFIFKNSLYHFLFPSVPVSVSFSTSVFLVATSFYIFYTRKTSRFVRCSLHLRSFSRCEFFFLFLFSYVIHFYRNYLLLYFMMHYVNHVCDNSNKTKGYSDRRRIRVLYRNSYIY